MRFFQEIRSSVGNLGICLNLREKSENSHRKERIQGRTIQNTFENKLRYSIDLGDKAHTMISMNTQENTSDSLKSAIESLEKCEVEIFDLVGDAAKSRDGTTVTRLNELAQNLAHLRQSLTMPRPLQLAEKDSSESYSVESSETKKPSQRNRSTKRRSTGRPKGYPKFNVEGNSLVKISWSKSKKSEYIHKAPKRVLEKLVEVLLEQGGNGEVIATDSMFPLEQGEKQYPDYQSYLCLLWLKQNKLVIHHGREGYQVADVASLKTTCERLWAELFAA